MTSKKFWIDAISLLTLLGVCLSLRIPLLSTWGFELFNSDQAMIGIMAKHILNGQGMVYYYGQGYMGSLEAFVAAFFFLVHGINVFSVQLAPLCFYLLFLIINYYLVKKVFGYEISFIANLWLALSNPELTKLSVTALGGYPETLFFGSLILWLGLRTYENQFSKMSLFLLGLASGLAYWTNNLILLYFFSLAIFFIYQHAKNHQTPVHQLALRVFWIRFQAVPFFLRLIGLAIHVCFAGFVVWQFLAFILGPESFHLGPLSWNWPHPPFQVKFLKKWAWIFLAEAALYSLFTMKWPRIKSFFKRFFPLGCGFFIGAMPAIIYAIFDWGGYRILHASGFTFLSEFPSHLRNVLYQSFFQGMLGFPCLSELSQKEFWLTQAIRLFLWSLLLYSFLLRNKKGSRKNEEKPYLNRTKIYPSFLALITLGACLFNHLESIRYLSPLYFSIACFVGIGWSKLRKQSRAAAFGLLIVFVASQLALHQSWTKRILNPHQSPKDYAKVIEILKEKRIEGGYADYWISYLLTLLAKEEIIIAPYKSNDRFPAYTHIVDQMSSVAYVFKNDEGYPAFQEMLKQHKIDFEEIPAGFLRVFIVRREMGSELVFTK